ncbi:MAG: MarR family transcriptional regulator [Candidatus Thorarchaeota archaeon]|nr:MarR family transcriptional regulator [Candidatus Thorarchaeota archaeon]
MTRALHSKKGLDLVLVIFSISILSLALWTWISAIPVEKEVVFLATTIALVISLVLMINVSILVILRLQKRVTDLESLVTEASSKEAPTEKVVVITLTNTERRIINQLEDNGGQMAQDDLRRSTGLSKSTLSVSLTALERKSLVSRIESGRTKMVVLKRTVSR